MALENLTLFELHLENSRFGPRFGGEEEPEESESGGGRGMAVGVLLLVLAVAVAVGVRRYRGGGAEDTEQITIEHATEQ